MAEAAEASMAVADLSAAAAGSNVVAADLNAVAAMMAARGRQAEEAAARAGELERATIQAPPDVSRRTLVRRIFAPRSTMASGIPSATRLVRSEVLGVPAKRTIREAWRAQISPLATRELPTAPGTLLACRAVAGQAVACQEARPALLAERHARRQASVGVATVLEAVGTGATVGAVVTDGAVVGDGEVGASASDGRSGVRTGDRAGASAGIRGGTILIGMPPRQHTTPTIRIMAITVMTGPTIRRPTGRMRRPTATRGEATRVRQVPATTVSPVA